MADTFQVVWASVAESDLAALLEWVARENPDTAAKLLDALQKKCAGLEQFPLRGRIVPELAAVAVTRYRELIHGNFRILYTVDGRKVGVVGVLDARRDLATLLLERFLRPR